MENKTSKKTLMERTTDLAMTISAPLAKLAEKPSIAAIQNGMVSIVPIITIGSIFMILFVLGSPSVGGAEHGLLPFLEPYAMKFLWVNNMTMGLMALYASLTIPASYAEITGKVDAKTACILGMGTFLLFTQNAYDEAGGIPSAALGAGGLFVCIVTSLVAIKLYIFLIEKNITIKMPENVPPNVSNAFTALIPYGVCFAFAWLIRTIAGFDMVTWLNSVLSPLVSESDSVFTCLIAMIICALLWSVGLHGDNMFLILFAPIGMIWLDENVSALSAGASVYELPHVLAGLGTSGLFRMCFWTAGVWPLIVYLLTSKVKYLRTLGKAFLPSSIFGIIEPVVFGLPLAMNQFLMIPFILSSVTGMVVNYLLMATPLFGKFYAIVPWATPAPLIGPLGTGDIKTALLPFISMAIGLVIYFPFWRLYEKDCQKREAEQEAAEQT